jgi:hypothetical protein
MELERDYATSWNVVGSILVDVIWFFIWPNLSSRAMVLESTQTQTEESTRNLPGELYMHFTKVLHVVSIPFIFILSLYSYLGAEEFMKIFSM